MKKLKFNYLFVFVMSFLFFLFLFFAFSSINSAPPTISGYSSGYGNCFDSDQDGYSTCNGDCNDSDNQINPGKIEICFDGKDNNCDNLTDCSDPSCDGQYGSKVGGIIDINKICCNRVLTNKNEDRNNCGGCRNICPAGTLCVNSTCLQNSSNITTNRNGTVGLLSVAEKILVDREVRKSLNDFFNENFANFEPGSLIYINVSLGNQTDKRIIVPVQVY